MEKIKKHLEQYNLDVRKTRDARFMDQKVTPDVLCIVADCILQLVGNDFDKNFTTKDVWENDYTNQNVKDIFNKPDVLNEKARSEYDKFFAQPMRMLACSGVLALQKKGNKNIFIVNNKELLEYIAIKERNALEFIVWYLEKLLKDSDVWDIFEKFFKENDNNSFFNLKETFKSFLYENTAIKSSNKYEPGRIFTKIVNPLAYYRKTHGTRNGFFSKDVIGYDELMYNRKNWRDVSKMREETRQEYMTRIRGIREREEAFIRFTVEKAKRLVRERHRKISEVKDELSSGEATQVHHIFPETEYPEIKAYLENLILLTASQHLSRAHPSNNTRFIDKDYQLLCLLSKASSIKESVENYYDGFYSKDDFIFVLNSGIDPDEKFSADANFQEIEKKLVFEYHSN